MTVNVDQIRVAADGVVAVGPVGATEPTDATSALSGAWSDLGAIDENGVTFSDGKTVVDIPIWQSFYPARRAVSAKDDKVSFNMREWSVETAKFAYGGGTVSGGKFTPPLPEVMDERALCVTWIDGSFHYRFIYRRGTVADPVATVFKRAAASDLPIGWGLLGPPVGVTDAWIMLTDDPDFIAGS